MKINNLKAPFPYFGGKRKVAHLVWPRFGNTLNYVEPFAGSLAVLLARPFPTRTETINDKDTYVSNFWRAATADPEQVAHYADWPVNEADLHSRHLWLVNQADFRERMTTDPEYFDAKIAGWWVWGLSAWIGSGWCATEYHRKSGLKLDGSVERKRPNLPMGGGRGVSALPQQRPCMEKGGGRGVHRESLGPRPQLRPAQGLNGQLPHLQGDGGASGQGVQAKYVQNDILSYMLRLQERLRRVRVTCGDWTRIMGPSVTYKIGMTGIFFDPPYDPDVRQEGLYAVDDDQKVPISTAVRQWCLEEIEDGVPNTKGYFKGPRYQHPKLRIALCGYEEEHAEHLPDDWEMASWETSGGYGNQNKNGNKNGKKERIWFSPNCLKVGEDLKNHWVNGNGKTAVGTDTESLPLFQLGG